MKYVKTNIGKVPVEDYLEIKAYQYGYDSYQALLDDGGKIELRDSDIMEDGND